MAEAITDPYPAVYAPTRTHSDALLARAAIRNLLADAERCAAMCRVIYNILEGRSTDTELSMTEIAQAMAYPGDWKMAVQPGAAVIYIDADLIGPIARSAETIPEIDSIEHLHLPRHGVMVLGQEIVHDPGHGPVPISALTWNWGPSPADRGWELSATPWVSSDWVAATTLLSGAHRYLPLAPNLPCWVDGMAPREEGFNKMTGKPYGWLDDENLPLRFLIAASAWMESVIDPQQSRVARAVRRKVQRKDPKAPSTVTTLKLRRLESKPWTPKLDADGRPVRKYSHRWIVSEHWRTVRCGPKRSRTRPVLVAPYIAGPPDKPLIVKDRIWKVDR